MGVALDALDIPLRVQLEVDLAETAADRLFSY
jgi:hypothetical protein